jgi:hypothetical protein
MTEPVSVATLGARLMARDAQIESMRAVVEAAKVRAKSGHNEWCDSVQGQACDCGHYALLRALDAAPCDPTCGGGR